VRVDNLFNISYLILIPGSESIQRKLDVNVLRPEELKRIEHEFSGGLSARAVLDIFKPHDVRLSEATFRKYVQAGLLPHSRRIGRKGRHRGSQGVYPVEVVRRILVIKKMLADGRSIDEIKRSFVFFKNHIDEVRRNFEITFDGFQAEISGRPFGQARRRRLENELASLRRRAEDLVRDVARFGSVVTAQASDEQNQAG
jgi:DNA-binding transcriptional MerR regulator